MKPSRRSFLQKSAMFSVAASASLPRLAWGGQDDQTISRQIGQQTLVSDPQSTFEQWIDGKFSISLSSKSLGVLTLASVESGLFPQTTSNGAVQRPSAPSHLSGPMVYEVKSTVLEFSRVGGYLPQNSYTFNHDWLGMFNLLLVPCLSRTQPVSYMAIFTRFTGRRVPMS